MYIFVASAVDIMLCCRERGHGAAGGWCSCKNTQSIQAKDPKVFRNFVPFCVFMKIKLIYIY